MYLGKDGCWFMKKANMYFARVYSLSGELLFFYYTYEETF